MRSLKMVMVVAGVLAVVGCASSKSDGADWKCSAQGLVSSKYTGGEHATIQLQNFTSAGTYKVTKNAQANEATGTTANGVPFKCSKTH